MRHEVPGPDQHGTQDRTHDGEDRRQDQALDAANSAFLSGFNEIILIGALVAIAGGILGLVLVRQRDFVGAPQPQAEEARAPEGVPAS